MMRSSFARPQVCASRGVGQPLWRATCRTSCACCQTSAGSNAKGSPHGIRAKKQSSGRAQTPDRVDRPNKIISQRKELPVVTGGLPEVLISRPPSMASTFCPPSLSVEQWRAEREPAVPRQRPGAAAQLRHRFDGAPTAWRSLSESPHKAGTVGE